MTQVTCKCGREFVKGTQICPWCDAPADNSAIKLDIPDTKVNRVLQAQIAAKRVEFENANGYGPTVCILIGLFGFFIIFPILFGIGGVIWSFINAGARDKIQAEIKVLEAQLEE